MKGGRGRSKAVEGGRCLAVVLLLSASAAVRLSALQCPDGTLPPCRAPAAPAGRPTMIVSPFENRSADTADAYLAVTLAEDVTAALAASRAVRLLTPQTRLAGVSHRLSAGVRHAAGALTVTVRLERAATGEIVLSERLERPTAEAAMLPDEIARRVLGALGLRQSPPTARPRSVRRPPDPATYDLYLRGRYQMSRRTQPSLARAVALFSAALERDSSFVLGWVGLARALERANRWHFAIPGMPPESVLVREVAASERAFELDSLNVEVWLMRAWVAQDVDPTSRVAVLTALRRAVALDSLHPEAWQLLGVALEETGDHAGALAALRTAVRLEPGQLDALCFLALSYYWARQYDSAAVWADSAVVTDPTFVLAQAVAGDVARQRGQRDAADAHVSATRRLTTPPDIQWLPGLVALAAEAGDTVRALRDIAAAETQIDSIAPPLHGPIYLGGALATLGRTDPALAWLERYRPRRDVHFQMHLRVDPVLDRLRGEARFHALLAP